jgi:RHS repeat-associated protein
MGAFKLDYGNYFYCTKKCSKSNHLGNVLTLFTDKKIPVGTGNTVSYYKADLVSSMDYSPFGAPLKGRTFNGSGSRYGFNGKENDNEVEGSGNWQDYGMRLYSPRLGRFPSVDPLTNKFAFYTPYQYAGNKPIWAVDLDGEEPSISNLAKVKSDEIKLKRSEALDLELKVVDLVYKMIGQKIISNSESSRFDNNNRPSSEIGWIKQELTKYINVDPNDPTVVNFTNPVTNQIFRFSKGIVGYLSDESQQALLSKSGPLLLTTGVLLHTKASNSAYLNKLNPRIDKLNRSPLTIGAEKTTASLFVGVGRVLKFASKLLGALGTAKTYYDVMDKSPKSADKECIQTETKQELSKILK